MGFPRLPESGARPGNPGAQPGGAARASPTSATLRLSRASLKPGPEGSCLNSVLPNEPGLRRHIATAPQGIPPEPAAAQPGPLFHTPKLRAALRARSPRPTVSQPPPQGSETPEEPRPASPEWGAALPSRPTQAHSHTKIIFFARRRKQRKSLTAAVVQQLKLGLGTRRGRGRWAQRRLRRAGPWRSRGGRGRVCAPLLNLEATSELLNQTEKEREKDPGRKFLESK